MSDKKQVVHTVIDAEAGISYKIVSGCSLTDTGNAERFITGFGDMVRYCADRKQWFMWNGKRWEPDTKGEVYELAKIAAIRIYEEIKYLDTSDVSGRAELRKFAGRSESQKSLRDMLDNAKTDGRVVIVSADFDNNHDLLNCPNGTLDKVKCEFREHRREDLLTKMTGAPLDFERVSAFYFPTLIKALPLDEALYAQLLLGSFLEYTTKNKEWSFVYGKPFAMKSSVTQPVYTALGDYAAPVPIELFIKTKQPIRSNQARPELIALDGVLIAWSEEAPPNFVIDESILKSLTSSGVKSTRALYRDQEILKLGCSFVIESNGTFTFDIDDEWSRDAALERTRVMKFVNSLPPDEREKDMLRLLTESEDELTAALAWVVAGYFLNKEYGIQTPESVTAVNKEFEALINPLASFVKNELEFGEGDYVSVKELLIRYQEVAPTTEARKLFTNERSFNIQLRKILPYFAGLKGVAVAPDKKEGGAQWLNIGLKDLQDEIADVGDDGADDSTNEDRLTQMTQNSSFLQSLLNLKSYMRVLHKIGVLRQPPILPSLKITEKAPFNEREPHSEYRILTQNLENIDDFARELDEALDLNDSEEVGE